MKEYKYLEIIEYATGKVNRRFDVTNESEHNLEKMERGANINLNHEDYYTTVTVSKKELPEVR